MSDGIFTVAWLAILAWFGVWETIAIVRKKRGDTLSEHVWEWFALRNVDNPTPWQKLRRFGFLTFWAWLTFHFFSGGSFL